MGWNDVRFQRSDKVDHGELSFFLGQSILLLSESRESVTGVDELLDFFSQD